MNEWLGPILSGALLVVGFGLLIPGFRRARAHARQVDQESLYLGPRWKERPDRQNKKRLRQALEQGVEAEDPRSLRFVARVLSSQRRLILLTTFSGLALLWIERDARLGDAYLHRFAVPLP